LLQTNLWRISDSIWINALIIILSIPHFDPLAESRIYCKFEAKFLCIVYKYILPIWNFLSNNFLKFMILQKIGTLPRLD